MQQINQNILTLIKIELFQREEFKEMSEEDKFFIGMMMEETIQLYLDKLTEGMTVPPESTQH